jgi:putative phosphoesterase
VRLVVISDSHDNICKLDRAGEAIASAESVIHCGDICSPFMVRRLGELAGDRPVHVVWGNNDGDPLLISKVAAGFPSIQLHGQLAEVELGGWRVAVNHYPVIARGLARSGDYDLVCYGHDHIRHESTEGACLLLNPGELLGEASTSTLAASSLRARVSGGVALSVWRRAVLGPLATGR